MTLDDFLSRLEGVRGRGNHYTARCPSHEDRSPSLSVSCGGDKILVYCFAGCSADDICTSLGLRIKDLYVDNRDGLSTEDVPF